MAMFSKNRAKLCPCHPFLYLCALVSLVTVTNVVYISRPSSPRILTEVKLLTDDEHTILSRIRFPDREKALILAGPNQGAAIFQFEGPAINITEALEEPAKALGKKWIIIGISSMSRPPGTEDYLAATLEKLLHSLDEAERAVALIVVSLVDTDPAVVRQKADMLLNRFREAIDRDLLWVVSPPDNIYPAKVVANNGSLSRAGGSQLDSRRLPYGNSPLKARWQQKLTLDFAYLFSYCSQLKADFFVNLEDDTVPTESGVVRRISRVVAEVTESAPFWNSVLLSRWLSIGRLYRTSSLHKLVDLILIAYDKQPVDFIMHHFDAIQMADRFRQLRPEPPLFEHVGHVSTFQDSGGQSDDIDEELDAVKEKNPRAKLKTNITQWQNFDLCSSYSKSAAGPRYFWGQGFKSGDVVDVVLEEAAKVKLVRILTGFPEGSRRPLEDRLVSGFLWTGRHWSGQEDNCSDYRRCSFSSHLINATSGALELQLDGTRSLSDCDLSSQKTKCLRLQAGTGQSDWLVIRLIQVEVEGQMASPLGPALSNCIDA